jgi:hypothetical protein
MTILGRAKKAAEAPPQVPVDPSIAAGSGKPPVAPKKRAAGGTKNKAKIHAVIGASGTGKSSYIKKELLRDYEQLIVWSPLEDTDDYATFCGGVVVRKITDLVAEVKGGAAAIVYWPAAGSDKELKTQFDLFCRVVFECRGAHVLVEELSQVTMPSWAPPAWKKLSTAGRHRGLTLIGVSQRPANIDKDFLGNCTEVRCYRVNYDADAKVMADSLGLQDTFSPTGPGGRPQRKRAMFQVRELPDFHFFHKNPDRSLRNGVNEKL